MLESLKEMENQKDTMQTTSKRTEEKSDNRENEKSESNLGN